MVILRLALSTVEDQAQGVEVRIQAKLRKEPRQVQAWPIIQTKPHKRAPTSKQLNRLEDPADHLRSSWHSSSVIER